MSVLSFAMVNNGVHWASDYPLALAIGGVVGKVVADRGRAIVRMPLVPSEVAPTTPDRRASFSLTPLVAPGIIGVQTRW